jgi:hypothetical protein
MLVIEEPHGIQHPHTVVVHLEHAAATHGAVVGTRGLPGCTLFAIARAFKLGMFRYLLLSVLCPL